MLIALMLAIENDDDRIKMEDIYIKYHDFMYKVAYKVTNNNSYSELAMSDALLAIMKNISKVRTENENELKGFIYTVTSNCARDLLRKNANDINFVPADHPFDENFSAQVDRSLYEIHTELERNETIEFLVKEILRMPDIYRYVLYYRYVDGFTVKEIAEITKTNLATVKSRLNRGILMLKTALKENGHGE